MTYLEILQAAQSDDLNKRMRVAVIVSADTVRAESTGTANHTARLAWASKVTRDPDTEGKRALWCALAQNKAVTLAQVLAATDASLQTAVDLAIDLLAI
jgi:hypothetical protein